MDITQTLEDIKDVAETFENEETQTENDIDEEHDTIEDEEEYIEIEPESESVGTVEEEREDIEEKSEITDETDKLDDFVKEFETKKTKDLPIKTEEQKKELRHLIRIKRKRGDDASEETPITPEEEDIVSDEESIESSVHPCLREIDVSDSQLKLANPYIVYPVPNDPGLLPAFWLLQESPPIYGTDGMQRFYDTVKSMGLRSISSLKDMFITDCLNLRYYGFHSPIMKAICDALVDNNFVQKLDLKDNKLSTHACKYLNNLLLKNNTISDLSLSGCQIGSSGAKSLYDAISENTSLKTLDLNSCNIRNEGFTDIASALSNNQNLESVNLSDNYLDKECSEYLEDLLSYSRLTHLDLSWNSLYDSTVWKALNNGLEKNETLRSLNLSWNSLNKECVPHLSKLLSRSRNIEKLDLSWNKFTEDDAAIIAKALLKNNMLQELYLGNNPLKTRGASALIHAITNPSDSALRLLDLENVWANKDVLHDLEMIKTLKPWVIIKLGGILSNYPLIGPNVKRILMKRANYEAMLPKRKKQRRNFGHFVMSLTDTKIPQKKFMQLVRNFRLKLSVSLINEIMNAFQGPENTVDQEQLKLFYLEEYPDTIPAPSKLLKKAKKKRIQ